MGGAATIARAGLCLAFACFLLWAISLALRRARADWLFRTGNPSDLRQAAALEPGSAEYRFALDSSPELEAAIRLNRYHTAGRIELALRAELGGEIRKAESLLLDASRFDRTYAPLWALANFYFRRGDRKQFFRWARAASEMAYLDQSALFDLCWQISSDGGEILREAIPDRLEIVAQYLWYLIRHGRLDAASGAAERLLEVGGPEQVPLFVAYIDALIRDSQPRTAWEWWVRLAARRWTPYTAATQEAPLTNGDFRVPPLEGGFDWRLGRPPGTHTDVLSAPGGVRFSFSGKQPERCRLLEQHLLLPPARACRLRFRYRTSGFSCPGGLSWQLADVSGRPIVSLPAHDLCGDQQERQIEFRTPAEEHFATLTLEYGRPLGSVRIEGELVLSNVSLECTVQGL